MPGMGRNVHLVDPRSVPSTKRCPRCASRLHHSQSTLFCHLSPMGCAGPCPNRGTVSPTGSPSWIHRETYRGIGLSTRKGSVLRFSFSIVRPRILKVSSPWKEKSLSRRRPLPAGRMQKQTNGCSTLRTASWTTVIMTASLPPRKTSCFLFLLQNWNYFFYLFIRIMFLKII